MVILLYQLLQYILTIVWVVIFVQVILSWLVAFNVVNRHGPVVSGLLNGLDRLTEPLYRPIRNILPDFGALDLAPMVVLLIVVFLQRTALPALMVAASPGMM
ncbi:YggT family protein [Sphingomonas sp.]|uniref:YggT family protein n=1 Tax=Sphingomonas sp. TaxID=28214 RepID=UPI003CC64547